MPVLEIEAPVSHASESVSSGPYQPFRYTLLSSQQIRTLSVLRPGRAFADIAVCWVFILAAFLAVALHPVWWTVLLAIPIIGNRFYALFIIAHDGMHRRLLPNVKRNDFWTDLLILAPIGAITRINNANHLIHHRLLASPQDPDRHKHGCFNKNTHTELFGHLTGVTTILRSVRAVFFPNKKETPSASSQKSALSPHTLRDFALIGGWFLALAGGLSWFIGWWAYPVLWLLPVYLFMYLGDNFRSFVEHAHAESDEIADHHRLITFLSNPIERMFVAPMNMNFHAVHHLWPSIPYYNLPDADQMIRNHPDSIGIEWRRSYFSYLFSYWAAVPIAECRPKQ